MTNLLDLMPDEAEGHLRSWLAERNEPAYRLTQIQPRLWTRPVRSWRELTDLPQELRADLERDFPLMSPTLVARQDSRDGTVKFLWQFDREGAIESVWIPEGRRRTLCISSQAGCAYGCRFCATGSMGFIRHLEPWEIVAQVREMLLDPAFDRPTNIVFMGMGEPLHNWASVDRALTILNGVCGVGIAARHITVSTVGLIPALRKLAARPEQFRLAWSLHAADPETRRALMPVERKYPLADVVTALQAFSRRITFEYVMIQGVNDGTGDARTLADLAGRLGAHVNLLPLHPGGAHDLKPTEPGGMRRFADRLRELGVNVTVRVSRGLDISAACGQLRTDTSGSSIASQQDGDIE